MLTPRISGLRVFLLVLAGAAAAASLPAQTASLVKDINTGGTFGTAIEQVTAGKDKVFFVASELSTGRELWVSDGTAAGTRLLEVNPGPRGSYPQAFRVIGDRVVFAADDGVHGLAPWVTDGTPDGTHLAADVMAGLLPSSPRDFAAYGDDLFFNAGRPWEGFELWKLPLAAVEP
jgi:ELWxxDGT repeat protein